MFGRGLGWFCGLAVVCRIFFISILHTCHNLQNVRLTSIYSATPLPLGAYLPLVYVITLLT